MTHLKRKLMMTLVALLAVTTGAWAQTGENIFQYCYDCQRNPAYPKTTASASLSGFANPYVGYKGIGSGKGNTSAGPWKLEYMGIWSTTDKHGINSISNYQSTYNCTDVPVFRLYQWNATANEYQHAAYGVVCAYAKVSNAVEHTAMFVAEGGWGCVLTNSSHSSSMNITFDEDLTTGLTTLIAAATPSGTSVEVAWDKAKKTGTFEMPAFDVELTPIYEPEFTAAFKAGNANTIQGSKATVSVTESDGTTAYTGATLDENGNYKPLYEGQKITMTAAAGYKLKSVTAVPTGGINGKFSISATKQVYFSKGNLQATYDGSTWSWDFAKNQWDYIGADNNKVNGNGSVSSNCTIDVFGWSTSSNYFGIHNSNTDGDYSGDFVDWGTAIGSGWRTLTHDEWNYLLQSRTTTSGLLFAKANLFGTVHGLILFPDNYTHPDGLAAITAPNDATGNAGWNGNQYTAEEWAKMEAAGAVFLPAAGCREGTTNHNFNVIGYYHTATPADANNSYDVAFHASVLEFDWNQPNHWAFSVRLVYEPIEVTFNTDKTEAKFAMPASDVTANYTLVRDMTVGVNATIDDRIRIKKDGNDYQAVDATQMNPVVKDNLETNSPVTLTVTTDYTLQLQRQSDTNADEWTDATALSVGTFRYKITGAGNYSGICYSEEFALFEGYKIKVAAGEYATYYKDEPLYADTETSADAVLYTVSSVSGDKAVLSSAITTAPKKTPLLIFNNSDEDKTFLLIPANEEPNLALTVAPEFQGTLTGATIAASTDAQTNYALNGKQFVWVKDAIEVGPNKAWLSIPSTISNARALTIVFSDATGINGVIGVKEVNDGSWYDLNGRKLNGMPTKKGVYIMNGRKVVIK